MQNREGESNAGPNVNIPVTSSDNANSTNTLPVSNQASRSSNSGNRPMYTSSNSQSQDAQLGAQPTSQSNDQAQPHHAQLGAQLTNDSQSVDNQSSVSTNASSSAGQSNDGNNQMDSNQASSSVQSNQAASTVDLPGTSSMGSQANPSVNQLLQDPSLSGEMNVNNRFTLGLACDPMLLVPGKSTVDTAWLA